MTFLIDYCRKLAAFVMLIIATIFLAYKRGEKNIENNFTKDENELLKKNLQIKQNEIKSIKDADLFIANELRRKNEASK
jgi:sensor domain CHASE-containing protein